jgi:membrane-associated phospholipid phosphatase
MALFLDLPATYDGSGIDGSWFTDLTDLARHTPWLNGAAEMWSGVGLGVFAVLMVIAWWRARQLGTRTMALALAAPVSVVTAFVVAEVVKRMVDELRPCYSMTGDYFVSTCPARTDYAFPSGHATVAFAAAAALWLVERRLGVIAGCFALVEGFTRVYVGAHYPHDVIAAAVLAIAVATLLGLAIARLADGAVARLRLSPLRPVLAAGAAGD